MTCYLIPTSWLRLRLMNGQWRRQEWLRPSAALSHGTLSQTCCLFTSNCSGDPAEKSVRDWRGAKYMAKWQKLINIKYIRSRFITSFVCQGMPFWDFLSLHVVVERGIPWIRFTSPGANASVLWIRTPCRRTRTRWQKMYGPIWTSKRMHGYIWLHGNAGLMISYTYYIYIYIYACVYIYIYMLYYVV